MRYCLDTRFLFAIAEKNKKHEEMFESFYKGFHYVVLPTVCVSEFVSRAHTLGKDRKGISSVITKFIDLNRSQMLFNIEGLSVKVAIEAGKLQHRYRMSLGDSIVAATALDRKCNFIITDDPDFKAVRNVVKAIF